MQSERTKKFGAFESRKLKGSRCLIHLKASPQSLSTQFQRESCLEYRLNASPILLGSVYFLDCSGNLRIESVEWEWEWVVYLH